MARKSCAAGPMRNTILTNYLNYGFQKGELAISQRQSIIRLIPKKDKDLSRLKNWRPISLLNLDYKIATKALLKRKKSQIFLLLHLVQCIYRAKNLMMQKI